MLLLVFRPIAVIVLFDGPSVACWPTCSRHMIQPGSAQRPPGWPNVSSTCRNTSCAPDLFLVQLDSKVRLCHRSSTPQFYTWTAKHHGHPRPLRPGEEIRTSAIRTPRPTTGAIRKRPVRGGAAGERSHAPTNR